MCIIFEDKPSFTHTHSSLYCHDVYATCFHLKDGDTPVMMSVKSGNIETLDVLLEANCDVNTKNKVRGRG